MTFKTGRTIKRSAAALVAAVVVATVMVAGGGLATHSTAPAEASAIHIAVTQEPVPASNAQPGPALGKIAPAYPTTCPSTHAMFGDYTPYYHQHWIVVTGGNVMNGIYAPSGWLVPGTCRYGW